MHESGSSKHDVAPRVQARHRTLIHAVCDVIERQIDRHG
jgi:hypothetical protein